MKIFVVEKDKQFRELIGRCLLGNTSHEVKGFDNEELMLNKLNENPNVIIFNNSLEGSDTESLISQILKVIPSSQILLICHPDDINTCTAFLGKGLFDYLTTGKGFLDRLLDNVQKLNTLEGLKSEIHYLKSHINRKFEISNAIVGESKAIKNVLALIEKRFYSKTP